MQTGGYHVVNIGDIYNERYQIEKKQGWGHFSTVWLASDLQVPDTHPHKLVALKIQKGDTLYTDAARDEIDLQQRVQYEYDNLLREQDDNENTQSLISDHVIHILDHFMIYGPNGKHICLVLETCGIHIFTMLKRKYVSGQEPYRVKLMARQILMGTMFLHERCNIIHTDLKPENILLVRPTLPDLEKVQYKRCKKLQETKYKELKLLKLATKDLSDTNNGEKSQENEVSSLQLESIQNTITPKELLLYKQIKQQKNIEGQYNKDEPYPWEKRKKLYDEKYNILSIYDKVLLENTIKIGDLGTSCWINKHFTNDVTTRQYRAPEVIVQYKYCTPIDIWSIACILFEQLTGDYLFCPKEMKGKYTRDEDHIAQMLEQNGGPFPKCLLKKGILSNKIFTKNDNKLKNIHSLQIWKLEDVLYEKYGLTSYDSYLLSSFLDPMLRLNPNERSTARECLTHPWQILSPHDYYTMYKNKNRLEYLPEKIVRILQLLESETKRTLYNNDNNKIDTFTKLKPYTQWYEQNKNIVEENIYKNTVDNLPEEWPNKFWDKYIQIRTSDDKILQNTSYNYLLDSHHIMAQESKVLSKLLQYKYGIKCLYNKIYTQIYQLPKIFLYIQNLLLAQNITFSFSTPMEYIMNDKENTKDTIDTTTISRYKVQDIVSESYDSSTNAIQNDDTISNDIQIADISAEDSQVWDAYDEDHEYSEDDHGNYNECEEDCDTYEDNCEDYEDYENCEDCECNECYQWDEDEENECEQVIYHNDINDKGIQDTDKRRVLIREF